MTDISNNIIRTLEDFQEKGGQILFFAQSCGKLETEEEKLDKTLKIEEITEEDLDDIERSHSNLEEFSGEIGEKDLLMSFEETEEEADEENFEREETSCISEESQKETVATISAIVRRTVASVMDKERKLSRKSKSKDDNLKSSLRKEEILKGPSSLFVKRNQLLKAESLPILKTREIKTAVHLPKIRPVEKKRAQSSKAALCRQVGFTVDSTQTFGSFDELKIRKQVMRPKTSTLKSKSFQLGDTLPDETSAGAKDKTIKQITISTASMSIRKTKSAVSLKQFDRKPTEVTKKSPPDTPPSYHDDILDEEGVVKDTFQSLQGLERLWSLYNKVYLDLRELKEEKKVLSAENKHFRGMIRAILEAAALDKTATTSKISTRVGSKYRDLLSAQVGHF